ncbi:hypothetical protein [Guptibacillus hwajinpoensis]|uniref:PglD-related sugar-binding protein n=1 Tax=Guptibacillus hwajinpoensis TaxID=208199 RepID=UPI0037368DAA
MRNDLRERLIIIGAKGHEKVVVNIGLRMCEWKEVAFLDDDEQLSLDLMENP